MSFLSAFIDYFLLVGCLIGIGLFFRLGWRACYYLEEFFLDWLCSLKYRKER